MTDFKEIRRLVANYMRTEGCSCCRDMDGHDAAKEELGKVLKVAKYDDGSGRDFHRYAKESKPASKREG